MTLHLKIHTAVRSLNILHSGRTCPHHAQEPCHSWGWAFVVVAWPELVSASQLWCLGFGHWGWFMQEKREMLPPAAQVLPACGGPALPNRPSTPPFAEDSVLWSLRRGCAEQRTCAPTLGTTVSAAWPSLRHINSWEWFLRLGSCESAGEKSF